MKTTYHLKISERAKSGKRKYPRTHDLSFCVKDGPALWLPKGAQLCFKDIVAYSHVSPMDLEVEHSFFCPVTGEVHVYIAPVFLSEMWADMLSVQEMKQNGWKRN